MHQLLNDLQFADIIRYIRMVDPTPAECDGATNILHFLLTYAQIPHQPMVGHVLYEGQGIPLHYWITLQGGVWTLDLRLRMWLGQRGRIPHGLFITDNWPKVQYHGEPVQLDPNAGAMLAKLYILKETDHVKSGNDRPRA